MANEITGYLCPSENTSQAECQYISVSVNGQLDYTQMAQFWGVAFTTVVALYLFCHCISLILKFVRNS